MKAFLIAGTNSGCGKTTMTLGIMRALARKGLRVQPFKVGPDYIDTAWHTRVSGVASRNLDGFMLDDAALLEVFAKAAHQADVSVIEGVMGMYDGYGNDPFYCSSAGVSLALDCPVLLVVDGKAVSTSAAATVMGFQHFAPNVKIAGVLLNHVNSQGHFDLLKTAIEHYCQIPVFGRLPKVPEIELPSRHLGLLTAHEAQQFDQSWDALADVVAAHIDLDALLALAELPTPRLPTANVQLTQAGQGLTVAVAHDAAFNFYYQDNLDLLERCGVTLRYFSPLHDHDLPECDLIYIGGGYPEMYGRELEANHSMREALLAAHQQGVPIYAECGGLMYLGSELCDLDDNRFAMVGILDGRSSMTSSLNRFGYCFAKAQQDTLLCEAGTVIRGHEFHYSQFTTDLPAAFSLYKERDGERIASWQGGYQVGNTLASYLHVHFAQNERFLLNWFARARENQ